MSIHKKISQATEDYTYEILQSAAKYLAMHPKEVRKVAMPTYPTSDDYYAAKGTNPRLWFRSWREVQIRAIATLEEYGREVECVEILASDFGKWAKASNMPCNEQSRIFYACQKAGITSEDQRINEFESPT